MYNCMIILFVQYYSNEIIQRNDTTSLSKCTTWQALLSFFSFSSYSLLRRNEKENTS